VLIGLVFRIGDARREPPAGSTGIQCGYMGRDVRENSRRRLLDPLVVEQTVIEFRGLIIIQEICGNGHVLVIAI
jgi:hypothetical protein